MIFSYLLRRLCLLLLFAVVFATTNNANAQCPGGRPPNRAGKCVEKSQEPKPATTKQSEPKKTQRQNSANNCSINVRVTKQGGEPLAKVNLILDDGSQNNGVTDATGAYKFSKLTCKRNYKIIPAHPDFTFNLASITITNLPKNGAASFIASTREKIAKVEESLPCNPQPKTLPKIKFDEPVVGKLSPLTAWCEESAKGYFHSYELDGALGGDIVQYELQSEQSADLLLQVVDQNGNPIEASPETESDDPAARQLTLPKTGDYFLRVIDKSNKASDYRLSLTRKGLSDEGYRGQLERAYAVIAEPDRPTFYGSLHQQLERLKPFNDGKAAEQKINETIAILERLRELAPNKPDALSMLSAIYLYFRKDIVAARELALKALDLGGEARFRVNFGEKLDRDQRRVTDGNYPCWLIIRKGKISCEGLRPNEGDVFNSNPQMIAKKPLDILNYYFGLSIYGEGKKANKNEKREGEMFETGNYYFVPLSSLDLNASFPLNEVQTIKSLIREFVEVKKDKK
jgi:hypothetical protein